MKRLIEKHLQNSRGRGVILLPETYIQSLLAIPGTNTTSNTLVQQANQQARLNNANLRRILYLLLPDEILYTNPHTGKQSILKTKNASISQDTRTNELREQDLSWAEYKLLLIRLEKAKEETAQAFNAVLERTLLSYWFEQATGEKPNAAQALAIDLISPSLITKGARLLGNTIKGVGKGINYLARMDMPRFGYAPTTQYYFKPGYIGMNGVGTEKKVPVISYGYDRASVAKESRKEFTDETRRPLIIRTANKDNTLADALNKVMSGTSETRFGTRNRTMTEPGPHEVLTGTYWDLKTGLPVVRGSGLIGTEPIPVTATEGTYKSSDKFGNMSSVTNSTLGAGKYGFRNWNELEDYVLNLDLNKLLFNYIADLINRTKSFENGLKLGPRTTQGLISKTLRNNEKLYQQYLADLSELSDWLMGNMNFGAKNQRVVFTAPKALQIIIGESDNPGFATRTANIGMELKDFTGRRLMYHQERGVPKDFWPNGMQPETYFSKYNTDPSLLRTILSSKYNPSVIFPLHFRGIGPNPFSGMTTMLVKGIRSTFKKGGKLKVQ